MSLGADQINVIRKWIQTYSLQFYDGVFSLLDKNGINNEVWNLNEEFKYNKAMPAPLPTGFVENVKPIKFTAPAKITGGDAFTDSTLMQFKMELNNGVDYSNAEAKNYLNPADENDFIKYIVTKPKEVLLHVASKKIPFDGSKFVEYTNPDTDDKKFLNLLVYYLNFNQIWQRMVNTIRKLKSVDSGIGTTTGTSGLYTYNKSALGTSSLDVTNFRPWGTFGAAGFGRNPNFYPFGGNIVPMGFVGGGVAQRGGNGQACSAVVKQVVDAVLNANNVDKGTKDKIDEALNDNIKYETLINQKLQQVVAASQTSTFGVNTADVTKYLGELQKLLDLLKDNQGLLFNTLRLSVSPTAFGYKIPTATPTYRPLGDMIGGGTPEQTAEILCLLNRIATKLQA
jgi:hypothetical protein